MADRDTKADERDNARAAVLPTLRELAVQELWRPYFSQQARLGELLDGLDAKLRDSETLQEIIEASPDPENAFNIGAIVVMEHTDRLARLATDGLPEVEGWNLPQFASTTDRDAFWNQIATDIAALDRVSEIINAGPEPPAPPKRPRHGRVHPAKNAAVLARLNWQRNRLKLKRLRFAPYTPEDRRRGRPYKEGTWIAMACNECLAPSIWRTRRSRMEVASSLSGEILGVRVSWQALEKRLDEQEQS